MSDIHSTDYKLRLKDAVLGAQMLFVAFVAQRDKQLVRAP